jgi:methyl-accepting chemotaxis protein
MAEKKRIKFGILFKMSLVMVLVATIPLAVVWYISHSASEQAISSDVNNRLASTADQLRVYIESWIDMNVRVTRQNGVMPDMVSMNGARQKGALVSITKAYEWVYLAFTFDIRGMNIGRSDSKDPKDYSDRHYVRQVLGGKQLGQQVLISKTTGKPALVLATAIKDSEQRTIGGIAVGVHLTDISQKVASIQFGKTGHAILLDQDGKVISHFNKEFTEKRSSLTNHPGFEALMLKGKNSLVYTNENGNKVFCQMRKTAHGWILLVEQDYDEAFAALSTYNQQTKFLMLVTLVVVLIVAFVLSRQLTRPLRELTAAADSISRGDFDYQISDDNRSDEIGELARSVERLASSVRLAMERFSRQ